MKKSKKILMAFIVSLFMAPLFIISSTSVGFGEEKADKPPMDLNNTEWEVEMVYVTEKGKKNKSDDKLLFKDGKFISEEFEDNGYEPTNYSLTLEEDGTTRFGTMQLKGKETTFWKGKVKGDTVDGSVHTQFGNAENRTTYFTGKLVSGALKPKEKVKPKFPTPTPPPPPPAAEPAVETEPIAEKKGQETVEQAAAEIEAEAEKEAAK